MADCIFVKCSSPWCLHQNVETAGLYNLCHRCIRLPWVTLFHVSTMESKRSWNAETLCFLWRSACLVKVVAQKMAPARPLHVCETHVWLLYTYAHLRSLGLLRTAAAKDRNQRECSPWKCCRASPTKGAIQPPPSATSNHLLVHQMSVCRMPGSPDWAIRTYQDRTSSWK